MKTMFKLAFVATVFMIISCSQETVTDPITEDLNAIAAKGGKKVTKPMKGNMSNAPVEGAEPIICDTPFGPIPVSGMNYLFGNLTHIGKLQEGSFGVAETCEFIEPFTIKLTYKINYIAPNGDELTGESEIFVTPAPDFLTGVFTGTAVVTGGTGRFEGAEGGWDYNEGSFVGDISTWKIDGEVTY